MERKPDDQPNAELVKALHGVLRDIIQNNVFSPIALLTLKATWESAEFAEGHIANARTFYNIRVMRDHLMEMILPEGLVCEFGVWKGASITGFARKLAALGQQRKLYGFDSFAGFSEEWTGSPVGIKHFDVQGRFPKVPSNVELVAGYIEETYETFLHRPDIEHQKIAFLHIDTDTYSPASMALRLSCRRFQKGTIVLFDEFYGYAGWKHHEYRALVETAEAYRFTYEFVGFSHRAAAVRIVEPARS
jgi:hypothetical protein